MTNDPSALENIGWHWDDATEGGRGAARAPQAEDRSRYVFVRSPNGKTGEIQRLGPTGTPHWTSLIPVVRENAAVFAHRAGHLYAALYSEIATGCRVLSLDGVSGDVLWEAPLKGLGPLHHSKYSNLVQIRFIDDRLIVFGKESAGRYIEILDPSNGRPLFSKVMPPE